MTIHEKFIVSRWLYGLGEEPLMSDEEYNALVSMYNKQGYPPELLEYKDRSWSSDTCPAELLAKLGLQQYIVNVVIEDKTSSMETIRSYADLHTSFTGEDYPLHLSFKYDGWNVQASYLNGILQKVTTRARGNKSDALDLTHLDHLFPKELKIKPRGYLRIIGELLISDTEFAKVKKDYGYSCQRACISGVTKLRPQVLSYKAFSVIAESEKLRDMSMGDLYRFLQENGFDVAGFIRVDSPALLEEAISYMSSLKKSVGFATDGLVARPARIQDADCKAVRLGAWEEGTYFSICTGVVEEPRKSQYNCRLQIKPVVIDGRKYSLVNAFNLGYAIEMGVEIGAPVSFQLRSAVGAVLV